MLKFLIVMLCITIWFCVVLYGFVLFVLKRSGILSTINGRLGKLEKKVNEMAKSGIEIVEAGVDPAHQIDHCDHCDRELYSGEEPVKTCDQNGPLTLCEPCYSKAGNSVR